MAYNLRQSFLLANAAMVQELIQLAKSAGWSTAVFDSVEDAAAYQHKANNLMRSLAMHQPEYSFVRKIVRSKLEVLPTGKVQLHLGVPPAGVQMRGQPPKVTELRASSTNGELAINDPITTENWPAISIRLLAAGEGTEVHRITILAPSSPDEVQFLAGMMEKYGFSPVRTSPSLVMERGL